MKQRSNGNFFSLPNEIFLLGLRTCAGARTEGRTSAGPATRPLEKRWA